LVERVEQSRDERRSNRGSAPDLHETEVVKVADERVVGGCREGEGETPEVPLEDDDREGHHDDPEHGESRFSSSKTGVEKGDTGDHKKDETGRDDDEGLVTGLVPLVEVFGSWRRKSY
jgi:hypothetical protein